MARDYAKNNNRSRSPSPRKKSKASKKGWLYLSVLAGIMVMSYRYIDLEQVQRDVSKTVSLAKKQANAIQQQPKFEFYTRLPQPSEQATQPRSIENHADNAVITASNSSSKANSAPSVPSKHYVIQVASFRKFTDADKLRASLILQGYPAQLSKFTNNNTTWHRVEVGPFESLKQAVQHQALLEKLHHSGLIKSIG